MLSTYHQKSMQDKIDFLRLQLNTKVFYKLIVSLSVGVHSQACPKYPKQVYNIFSIKKLKENVKGEVDFLPADKCQMFPQIDTTILGVWPVMPKLPKVTSLLFLCNIL